MAALLVLAVFVSVQPFCVYKRRWPEMGATVVMLLSTTGIAFGFKVSVLVLYLPAAQLGALAGDKPALIIGGLATLTLSVREAVENWRGVTGV